jgi:riboflavin kinase/FMN adenylyltransferase
MITFRDGQPNVKASVVALGMFDGVHFGHRMLLEQAKRIAEERGVPMVVCTFAQSPMCLLAPDHCPPLLTTPEEREALLAQAGADIVEMQTFTPEIRDQAPEDFIAELVGRWHPVTVVAGFNYTFGRGGKGTAETLKALGKTCGFKAVVIQAVRVGGDIPVSSTGIREDLANGRVRNVYFTLGRYYSRAAKITRRQDERCTLRFEEDGKQTLPENGYYALLGDGARTFPALVRIAANGGAVCRLPPTAKLKREITVTFLDTKLPKR